VYILAEDALAEANIDDYGFLAFSSLAPDTPIKKVKKGGPDATDTEDDVSAREKAKTACHCGAANCIGWLGAKRKSREEQAAAARNAAHVTAKPAKKAKRV
jgi:hypothetical protein